MRTGTGRSVYAFERIRSTLTAASRHVFTVRTCLKSNNQLHVKSMSPRDMLITRNVGEQAL